VKAESEITRLQTRGANLEQPERRILNRVSVLLAVCLFVVHAPQANKLPALSWSIGPDLTLASELAEALSDTDNPGRPELAFDGTKYLLVTQNTLGNSNTAIGVFLSRNGAVLRSFPIATVTPWYQPGRPRVSFAGTNYLVVFSGSRHIWGLRISTDGVLLDGGTPFQISEDTELASNGASELASDGTDFLVVWQNYDYRTSAISIVAAKVTAGGGVSRVFRITTGPSPSAHSLAFDGENYLVAWQDNRLGTPPRYYNDLFGARVSKDGVVLDPNGFPICTADEDQGSPHVTFGGTNFFVVWVDERNGDYFRSHIYGARITKTGQVLDGPPETAGIPISTPPEAVVNPRAGFDGQRYFVAWELTGYQNNPEGNVAGIYMARLTQSGFLLDGPASTGGVHLRAPEEWASKLVAPEIRFDGKEYFVAWLLNREVSGQTKEIRGAFFHRTNLRVLKSFGSLTSTGFVGPQGILTGRNGRLYVTSREDGLYGKGSVCRMNLDGTGYEVIHDFGARRNDGTYPVAPLIEGTDGFLYGTTPAGGRYNGGTVFKLRRKGSDYAIIHHFNPTNEGFNPVGPLLEASNGLLYGTTPDGGIPRAATPTHGAIYRLDKSGGNYRMLVEIAWAAGPAFVKAFLLEGADGLLYGAATPQSRGNPVDFIFTIQKNGSGFIRLPSWDTAPAKVRYRLLGWIQGDERVRYRPSSGGGAYYNNVIARIRNDGTGYGEILRFEPTNAPAEASLITSLALGPDGLVYGTTQYGGDLGSGTVFCFAPPGELLPIKMGTNGCLSFDIPTQVGETFAVEASSDLINWTELFFARSTNEVFRAKDCPSPEFPMRYYRVKQE
jgi:uncharacterized repeat protein (TIGR03803 family)